MHKSWKLKINNEDFICLEWNERGWLTWDSACLRRTKTTGCGETSGRKQVRGDSAKRASTQNKLEGGGKRASTQNKLEGGGKRASTQKYLLLLLPVLLYRGKRRPRSSSFFCFQSCYIGENVDLEVAPSSASSLVYSFSVSLDLEWDLYLKRKIQGGGGWTGGTPNYSWASRIKLNLWSS